MSPLDTASVQDDLFAPLLTTAGQRQSEFKKRKQKVVQRSIAPADKQSWLEKGWELQRDGKRSVRIKRPKRHDEALEDRVWCLLYRLGYTRINGEKATISFQREDGTWDKKQIDAFAFDEETAIIVECKSRETRGRKYFSKDLAETAHMKEPIRKTVFSYFQNQAKPKLVWLYATQNVIWSEPDVERAESNGILILNDNEIQYYETFLNHIGPAGKYQVLAEFLGGQKIPSMPDVCVPAIQGTIADQTFYHFVATPRDLLKISYVNHQALDNPGGRPAYQRMINSNRIKEIGEYIKSGGFFPTNILLNFTVSPKFELLPNKQNTDKNIKFGWLHLPKVYKSAWVIDGQHRLYGYSHLSEKFLDQSLFVAAFEKMSTQKEADLFITINHKQKSVPKGLLVSLLADLRMSSPDPRTRLNALASNLVQKINADKTSPLYNRFTRPDVPADQGQNLTISETVKGLVQSNLIGKPSKSKKASVPGPLSGPDDDSTINRARRIINGHFKAIEDANPERWEAGKAGYIRVNPGVRAQLLLMAEIIRYLSVRDNVDFVDLGEDDIIDRITTCAKPVYELISDANDETIAENFSRKFGEGGVKEYYYNLCAILQNRYEDFGPSDFHEYMRKKEGSRVDWANKTVIDIAEFLTDYVILILKQVYGTHQTHTGDQAYWELGIKNPRIKQKAYAKQQEEEDVDKRLPKEAYLDIMDLKAIVEHKDNWPHFQSVFNIPKPGEKGGKKFYTSWMADFNELRRIPAHKSSLRTYSDQDLEFLDWLETELESRYGSFRKGQ